MYNCYHILRKNDNLHMPTNFIFFDTEAKIKQIDEHTQEQTFKLGWLKYKNYENKKEEYYFYDKTEDLWDYVEHHVGTKELYLIAHNTEYDMKISKGYEELILKRDWKVKKIYIEQNVFILTLEKNTRQIHILDSMNYVPKSLEEIGESLNIPKMKIDFDTCTDEELKVYCKNDVLILSTFMEEMISFLTQNELSRLKSTAGSIAFNGFRHKYYDIDHDPIHIHDYPNVIKAERESYRGGICDCFKIGKFSNKLAKLDINSMYPYIMRNKEIPIEYIETLCNQPTRVLKEELKTHHVIAKCTITIPEEYAYILTPIKLDNSKKSVFLKGTFTGTYSTPELEYILKYGTINKIHEMHTYKRANKLKEYVDDLYRQRMEYHEQKNYIFEMFTKILLNSLYGKFGQKSLEYKPITPKVKEYFDNAWNEMEDIESRRYIDHADSHTKLKIGETKFEIRKTELNSFDSFVAIASIITAYARMYLIEMLIKAGRNNVYYADTDCLIVNMEGERRLKDYIDDGTKQLGKLKVEGYSTNSTFYRPKFYVFDGETKCKGVKKKVFKHDKNNYIESEDEDILNVRQQQFERFKTSLRKKNMDKVMVRNIPKEIKKLYDKGRIVGFDVKPFDASEVTLCITPNRKKQE